MVVGGLIEDVAHPAFVNQARDTSQMGHDRRAAQWRRGRKSRAVRGSHRRRLCRGEWIDTPKLLKGTCVVRNVGEETYHGHWMAGKCMLKASGTSTVSQPPRKP
jgi:hypothetical protein